VVRKQGRPAGEVCHRFEPVAQVLGNLRLKGRRPLENPAATKAIVEATARLGERG
jgi:phosphoglucosamine mutase